MALLIDMHGHLRTVVVYNCYVTIVNCDAVTTFLKISKHNYTAMHFNQF